ncbi:hypothetical protein LPUS_11299 [Lasallia pustulata]|uniref:Ubiquitin-like domain-containing protein n=1 Tax=Lasallia pustulata TaxID=136370 RepID=A0A1W5DC30_9LECA|nr:hypothetical protein LPUS_11299 [Lasallia pustulata]
MSFGFSVGDFITVGKLISDVVGRLRGAEQEYQELLRELFSLQQALHHVDKLNASHGQQPAVNAIKCAALMCQHPLREFLDKVQKYEDSLGLGKSKGLFWDLEKKSKWALCKKEDVRRLRDYLSIHIGSINMMLMACGLEMLSVATTQATKDNMSVQKDLKDSQSTLLEVRDDTMAQKAMLKGNTTMLGRVFGTISGDVVPQLKALVDMATRVWQTNLQIYEIVLKWQTVAPCPDLRHTWFQDPVKLEDALGRILPIPSEYGYSKVEAIIRDQFKVGPGSQKVLDGNYELLDARNSRVISGSAWTGLIPGMSIKMAIVLEQLFIDADCCPMSHCYSQTLLTLPEGGNVCSECKVWFGIAQPRVACTFDLFRSIIIREKRDEIRPYKLEDYLGLGGRPGGEDEQIAEVKVTTNDIVKEAEESAELRTFRNVRVKHKGM